MTHPGASAAFPFAADVRAVLFDVGNTLLWLDHARMAAIVTAAGLPCDEAAMRRAEMSARPRLDVELRAVPGSENDRVRKNYAELIVAELGAAPHAPHDAGAAATAALLGVWGSLWSRAPADAAATLALLASRGLALGCVSNSDGRVRARLERAGLAAWFACIVDSGLEGIEKPDPRIFRRAAERLGADPAACVYVGDFLALDVEGARAAGMHAVLMDPIGAWGDRGVATVAALAEIPVRLAAQSA